MSTQNALFTASTDALVTSDVARRLSGVTFRQLDYWARTGLLGESSPGSGHHRHYRFIEVVALRAVSCLLMAGISLRQARRVAQQLIASDPAVLTECTIVADETTVDLCLDEAALTAALRGRVGMVAINLRETVTRLLEMGYGTDLPAAPPAGRRLRAVS